MLTAYIHKTVFKSSTVPQLILKTAPLVKKSITKVEPGSYPSTVGFSTNSDSEYIFQGEAKTSVTLRCFPNAYRWKSYTD